jgi:hypothetical protein
MNPRSLWSKSTADAMAKILKYCALFYLLSTSCYLLLYAYPSGWSDDILLTPEDTKNRGQCDVDADSFNNVWVVWDSATWVAGTAEVLFTKRDSMGGCLIPETPVSNNPTFSTGPRLAVDATNNAQFIWRDWSPQGDGIWHAKLANDGSTLVPSHLAVSGAGGGESTLLPEMVINKYNELYIIWDESPSGYNQMNFTRLDSLGNPIIAKTQVSLPGIYAYWPGIGVDSFANAHLAYRSDSGLSDRLTYSKLDRNGNVLISNQFYGTGLLPTIIADQSQNMHIVYEDPSGPGMSIEYLKLDQGGNVLVGPLTLSVHEGNSRPHMAMDSLQYLHVVWDAESSGAFPIMYTKLDTLGNFVIPPMQVVYPPYTPGGGMARIAVDLSNRLHLIWVDGRVNPGVTTDIFYKRGENEPGIEETDQSQPAEPLNITITPNPFRYYTNIRYMIHDTGYTMDEGNQYVRGSVGRASEYQGPELKIYDAVGLLVKEFRLAPYALRNTLSWDGRDDQNRMLADGVYFLRLEIANNCITRKIVKLE